MERVIVFSLEFTTRETPLPLILKSFLTALSTALSLNPNFAERKPSILAHS